MQQPRPFLIGGQWRHGETVVPVNNPFTGQLLAEVSSASSADAEAASRRIDDPRELEKQVPGLRLVTAVSFLTMPELVKLLLHSRAQAMLYGVLARFAWYRRSMQHLRYDF